MSDDGIFVCPYYHITKSDKQWCEGGKLIFPDELTRRSYQTWLCKNKWEHCSLSIMLNDYYERMDYSDEEE